MWQEFIKQLSEVMGTLQYDLINASFGLFLLLISMLLNQLAGSILALIKLEFKWGKLLHSIVQGFCIAIVVLGLCTVIDLVPVLLERTKLIGSESIVSQVVTVLEVVAMIVIALVKYIKDIYDKLLKLFNVKKEEVDEAIQSTFNTDMSVMENADSEKAVG